MSRNQLIRSSGLITIRLPCNDGHRLITAVFTLLQLGLHLLGFKTLNHLKRHYHLRTAQFIYPDESVVRGSRSWFTTLLQVCLDRRLFALALYVQRKNLAPRLVALTPQEEQTDEDGLQTVPPGFHVLYLPYADDFRDLQLPSHGLGAFVSENNGLSFSLTLLCFACYLQAKRVL
ncbi:hypothetical protein AHF37_08265 [Paragonimus kellicotti]|nr:hypothetical protein AHF37_08265 [Paragonimus kellicotti]